MRRSLSSSALHPSSAPTGRRLLPVSGESGAVVQGAGLTRRRGPHARLEGGAGVQLVHHRLPPRRTDAAAWGAGRVIPPTGTGEAVGPLRLGPNTSAGSRTRLHKRISLPSAYVEAHHHFSTKQRRPCGAHSGRWRYRICSP